MFKFTPLPGGCRIAVKSPERSHGHVIGREDLKRIAGTNVEHKLMLTAP